MAATVLDRLLSSNRTISPKGADEQYNRLAKEYLRRSAIWAQTLECASDWPFFDVTHRVDPDNEVEAALDTALRAHLQGPGKVGPLMSRLLIWSLRWSTLSDLGMVGQYSLPDPYEPIVCLYETGGEIILHHGMILTPVYGFQLRECEYYAEHPSYVSAYRT